MPPSCTQAILTSPLRTPRCRRRRRPLLAGFFAVWLAHGCGSSDPLTTPDPSNGNISTVPKNNPGGTLDLGTAPNKDFMAVTGLNPLPLSGCVYSVYAGNFNIGTDTFQLLVDSGSSTTAVAGSACTTCSALTPLYLTDRVTPVGASVDAKYGDMSGWSGPVYRDVMGASAQGGMVTPQVPVDFAAMNEETDFFTESVCPGTNNATNAYQGILGLGPDVLLLDNTTSYLAAIKAAGTFKNDAFAVQLCDKGGQMWFGGYDPSAVSGDAVYTPMVPQSRKDLESNYYGVSMRDMQVNGKSLGLDTAALGTSVVDTGTSAFLVSATAYQKLVVAIAADPNFKAHFSSKLIYQQSCDSSSKSPRELDAILPTLGVTMPGETAGSTFTLTLKATESYLFGFKIDDSHYYYCSALTVSSQNILGAAMMRNHVVVFDRDNDRVGFVPQTSCSPDLPILPSN
jgi:hypothetical protein